MEKEFLQKIFDEAYNEWKKNVTDGGIEKFSDIDAKNTVELMTFFYLEAVTDATEFMWSVAKKILDSEEFKKNIFEEMMKQAKEHQNKTGNSVFSDM